MLLVDALYINYGGALSLLRYLIDKLKEENKEFFLLADDRCEGTFDTLQHVQYLKASVANRIEFYKTHKEDYSSVFCFGNVPPPIKMKVPVYTYFHNINMLTLSDCRDKKQLIKFWLKRYYIKTQKNHTSEWFVQTSNTAKELIKHLGVPSDKVKLFPFYKLPQFPNSEEPRTDYIFVGEYSGSKGHEELLEAWKLLHKTGIDRTLHLTVSLGDEFLKNLQEAIDEGVQIINHGYIPVEQLVQLYMKSKATIYPSYNESFGLGLVEAMEAGCDVIGADLPYTYAICKPSEVFDPSQVETIVNAVVRYETGNSQKTELLVSDMIDEMINRISNNTL